jgi:hypothetical protein
MSFPIGRMFIPWFGESSYTIKTLILGVVHIYGNKAKWKDAHHALVNLCAS